LFSANDGSGEITALNITISDEWMRDPRFLLTTLDTSDTPGASRNDNILRMINALREPRDFEDVNGTVYRGSFLEYLGSINTEMALEVSYHIRRKDTSDINLLSIDMYRASIMDVDSDEEAMNLMRFQKSYNAAVRFMTTLDEMLDMVVNRMGVVGR
jgi:flagellar hook-associated protein 1 FlgK